MVWIVRFVIQKVIKSSSEKTKSEIKYKNQTFLIQSSKTINDIELVNIIKCH